MLIFNSIDPSILFDLSPYIALIGAVSVIYGAVLTIRQTDLKRLIAFSSVSHMGYIILGLSSYNAYSSLGSSEGLGVLHFNYLHMAQLQVWLYLVGLTYEELTQGIFLT